MRPHTLVGLVAILAAAAVGGCSATAPNPSPTPLLFPSAVAASTTAGGSGPPCAPDQLSARAGDWGPAAGTTYVLIHVSLASGAPCALPAYPAVDLVDAAGAVIASGPSGDPATLSLATTLDLRLGWASWCASPPPGPIRARLNVGSGSIDVALPDGFSASCQGVPTIVQVAPANS